MLPCPRNARESFNGTGSEHAYLTSFSYFDKKLEALYERAKEIRMDLRIITIEMKENKAENVRTKLSWDYDELWIELTRLVGDTSYNLDHEKEGI